MRISPIIDTIYDSSNILDQTPVFDNTVKMNYPLGTRFQEHKTSIFENTKHDIIVNDFDPNIEYKDGDVVYENGYVRKVLPPQDWPLTPEDSGYDTTLDISKWEHRYTFISEVDSNYSNIQISYTGSDGTLYEYGFGVTGLDPANGSNSIYIDIRQKDSGGQVIANRQYSRVASEEITPDTLETESGLFTNDGIHYSFTPTFYYYDRYASKLYFRNNTDVPQKTKTLQQPRETINVPSEIPGFSFIEVTDQYKPFDYKNYTTVKKTDMSYSVKGGKPFNCICVARLKGSTIDVKFGSETTISRTINGWVDQNHYMDPHYTTEVFYSAGLQSAGTIVTIDVNGEAEVGSIALGVDIDAGFTNLSFKNKYKDFSVFEYDPFGNATYTDRAKVAIFEGTADIVIDDYDRINRLMESLGKTIVIFDGSDSHNQAADASKLIFNSTQKLGRMTAFNQQTRIKDTDIDPLATYSFTLEEIV